MFSLCSELGVGDVVCLPFTLHLCVHAWTQATKNARNETPAMYLVAGMYYTTRKVRVQASHYFRVQRGRKLKPRVLTRTRSCNEEFQSVLHDLRGAFAQNWKLVVGRVWACKYPCKCKVYDTKVPGSSYKYPKYNELELKPLAKAAALK